MHSRFGLKYVAADAWADKCGATRQEGESGLAAIQRVDELQQNLALLGVPAHVGPASGKTTPWASQDIPGYPGIDFIDWDNPG